MKKYALSATIRSTSFDAMDARHTVETLKGSTGGAGKNWEARVRDTVMTRGIRSTSDFRARKTSKVDCYVKLDGRRLQVEVKTGGGVLGYGVSDAWDVHDILPTADLVAYALDASIGADLDTVLDNTFIFTRDEFIDFLVTVIASPKPRKGKTPLESAVKYNPKQDCINIQMSSTAHARAEEGLLDYPTLRTFMEDHGLQY